MLADQSDTCLKALSAPDIDESGFPWPARGLLHEIHADATALAAAMGFALGAIDRAGGKPIVLARCPRRAVMRVQLYGEGLQSLGVDPARLLLVETKDEAALLQAGLDAARCGGLGAVVLETWGNLPRYDLTASRRLVLAAEKSGTPVIVLRGDAVPRSSAAHSRWSVRPARSVPLLADAPGSPAIEVELSRRRGGPAGMRWRLEWGDENGGYFHAERVDAAPVSGAVVPVAPVRASAPGGRALVLHAFGARGTVGQRAAPLGRGRAGGPAGPFAGNDTGRRAGALPGAGEPAARRADRYAHA
ncbi:hypothetical protein GCM10011349_41580 [Novosphingobium indicum]|uniref:Protein ImuA n=1 Tax=Novosphingobium indicum TaxID=462949 RepID=A0ABQ2JXA8_9SPHN|nr:hypothetical protein [Novosphingobium indicum]GGN60227.1 hypothetical protein GCM10011349_41580 [Novosphingobium indicum]